jgi:hypothetical protein
MQTRVGVAVQNEMTLPGDRLFEPTIAWGSMRALTLPLEYVRQGDVVAVAQRFYRVDSVVQTNDRFGFPLLVLRSLETGASAAIEFRNTDAPVSVLRFPAALQPSGEAAGAGRPNSVSPATRSAARSSEDSRVRRPPAGVFLKEAIE